MADGKQENLEILDALIPGSDVNAPYAKDNDLFDQFLLFTAVRRGVLGFVQALLDAGANVNLPDVEVRNPYYGVVEHKETETLAHAAAERGFYSIFKVLIENNADVKTSFGNQTPLMAAAAGVAEGGPTEHKFQQCVELLVPRAQSVEPVVKRGGKRDRPASSDAAAAGGGAAPAKRAKAGDYVICMSKSAEVAFSPCGHLCVCSDCVPRAKKNCPICRKQFTSHQKIFFP